LTVGPSGPIALHDHYVVQKMQHFNRVCVPERVVHAKGSVARGFFEVTEDITQYTKASLFAKVGKRTPVFARFWPARNGFPDTVRDPRGFALKFYTDEGNYTTTSSATTRRCSSCATRPSFRTSSIPRSGCPTPARGFGPRMFALIAGSSTRRREDPLIPFHGMQRAGSGLPTGDGSVRRLFDRREVLELAGDVLPPFRAGVRQRRDISGTAADSQRAPRRPRSRRPRAAVERQAGYQSGQRRSC
jgi:hypothetical protein